MLRTRCRNLETREAEREAQAAQYHRCSISRCSISRCSGGGTKGGSISRCSISRCSISRCSGGGGLREEKFDHCKHEACEEPEDTEVARELELFVQVYSCREFVYSPCTKIVAASSLLASGGREGGREEE